MNRMAAGVILLICSACGGGLPEGVAGTDTMVPVREATTLPTAPVVPATSAEGRCEVLPEGAPFDGTLSIVFGQPTERRVNVTLDEDGEIVWYADMRGDLDIFEPHEDQTLIQLDFENRTALLVNRTGAEPEAVSLNFARALESERLDHPARTIDMVKARCVNGGRR